MISTCGTVFAQGPPPIPSDYSGYVTVNGEPAPDGALVFAKIEDYTSNSVAVSDGGRYSYLLVAPPDSTYEDKTIEFYVDPDAGGTIPAIMAAETGTFDLLGDSHEIDLTVVIVDETPPAPPPSPPPMPSSPTNEAPVADAGPDRTVYVDVAIHLNGADSHDSDGTIEEYHWIPGDGSYKPGFKVIHVYGEAGVYTASLTVVDNNGATNTDNCTVTVLSMPAPLTALIFDAIPANSTGYVVDASSWADTTVKVNTTDPVTVTIIKYETNPHPGDPMPGAGIPKYSDIFVSDPDAVDWPIYVEMSYTDLEIEGLEESSLGMYYWFNGTWQRCSDTGVDTERNVVWAYMTAEEASGSPILMGGMPAIITPPLPPFLDNLIITPDELELGDEVTINFDIENWGSQSQTYGVAIHIENVNDPPPTWPPYDVTMTTWVDLEAYEFKTVFFTITMDTSGDFNVTVAGMTASFKVGTWPPEPPLKPAEFVVSDLTIEPEEAELWEGIDDWTFRITANVTNIGEQEGTHTVDLKLDGLDVDWRTVKLGGGESAPITFPVTKGAGSYTVEVDGLTGSFTVKAPPKPAEFEFSDLRISYPGVIPPEVERDQTVTVTVSIEVENVGELEGSRTVDLKVDGTVVGSEEITPLGGGMKATVVFELTRGEGTYEVEVEGFTDSFTVNPKPTFWDNIPGFPYESIIIGLTSMIIILWYTRARNLTLKGKPHPTLSSDPT